MKNKLLFSLILFLFTTLIYSQNVTRKYNDLMERYEFYNSSRQIVGYAKYNSLQERWEYYNSNNQLTGYDKYNSLTGETQQVDLNQNNSIESSGQYIVHDYGEPQSTFDSNLAMLALSYKQNQYDRLQKIYGNLTLKQKRQVDEYIQNYNRKRFENYVLIGKKREVELYKNTIGFQYGFDKDYAVIYQIRTKEKARLEFELGYKNEEPYKTYKFNAIYQWIENLLGHTNYYVGLGVGLKKVDGEKPITYYEDINGTYGSAILSLGLEYNFNFPLIIFVNYQPEFTVIPDFDVNGGFNIGVRYGF
ncbi:hypothetical protein ES677_05255 [Bizionia gelidisalsuginis]|uniref:Uncharacterized protein n=2 Tax=Bizionia TaxID=283785 RepID=A0A8H2LDG6_9FLAO|nr:MULTISPECIES: hypothetical protein [Bizionia]TYB73036.1 hypothetical protein ES676_09775 [Bizionia saleffrena]TYC14788.1 hypothetical protein ES677_05255 [Bizionia gelidisalsuginis]